jgi:hypothetical protein
MEQALSVIDACGCPCRSARPHSMCWARRTAACRRMRSHAQHFLRIVRFAPSSNSLEYLASEDGFAWFNASVVAPLRLRSGRLVADSTVYPAGSRHCTFSGTGAQFDCQENALEQRAIHLVCHQAASVELVMLCQKTLDLTSPARARWRMRTVKRLSACHAGVVFVGHSLSLCPSLLAVSLTSPPTFHEFATCYTNKADNLK